MIQKFKDPDKTSASSFGTAHDIKGHQHSIVVIKTWGVGI